VIARDLGLELPQRKPLGIPRINPQHPLARGLTFATLLTGDGRPRDLIQGRTATGGPTAIRSTPLSQSLLFNGSSDACNFGDISQYRSGSQNFTIMAYANPPASSTTYGLASKRDGGTFQQISMAANMDSNGGPVSGLFGLFCYDGTNQLSGATTASPVNGAFHQYTAIRNSSTTLQFYVDAVSQSLSYASQNNTNYTSTTPLFIGAMGSTSAPAGGYLPGMISYVYIWRGRVLTAAEIGRLYKDPYVFLRESPRQEPWFTIWMPPVGGGTTVNPNAITTAEVVYGPAVTLQVLPGTIATAEAFFAPTVTLQVLPGTIATAEVVYGPTVSVGVLAGQISPNAIPTAEQVYAPTLTLQVLPGTIATGATVSAPAVTLQVLPGTIATGATVYSPTVSVLVGLVIPNTILTAEMVYGPILVLQIIPLPGTAQADRVLVGSAVTSSASRPGTATTPANLSPTRNFGDGLFGDLLFDAPNDPPVAPGVAYVTPGVG
jgi:hypothetical protein